MKKFSIIMIILSISFTFGLISCDSAEKADNLPKIQASNLMDGITARPVNTVTLDSQFRSAAAKFSLDLYRASILNSDDSQSKNSLISPASVLLALAMTANGADENTLSQMEQVLGSGMPISSLNAYLYSFAKSLTSKPKERISISNSIWFRDSGRFVFSPDRGFLQTNADYFGADAFAAPFDDQTVKDINTWISKATDGLIKQMLDSIPNDAVLYLINTVLFDAEWAKIYEKSDVRSGKFTSHNNQTQTAEFMHSSEYLFIQGSGASGFIKPYHSGRYSFAAILPDNDIDIADFTSALSGEEFLNLIENAQPARVAAALPKFDYDYEILMNDALIAMGIEEAFCEKTANLSRMGKCELVDDGNLYINRVKHKAYIAVDEKGTKAGAATVVEIKGESAPSFDHYVILDRPFVYAIIDNETNLPLFIGTLLSIP